MTDYDQNTSSYQRWSKTNSIYSMLEWYVLLETIGTVSSKNILDVACGEGRLSRVLMEHGAKSVTGTDISSEMIERADRQNLQNEAQIHYPDLSYQVVDARDESFRTAQPVDLVTALYLFHYADSEQSLERMCDFASRNLKPGGRFVTYSINPDYDFERQSPEMEELFGFRYEIVAPPEYQLVVGDFKARMWQWSRQAHEKSLKKAGLTNIGWHPLTIPPAQQHLTEDVSWYLENPSCIVLSAEKR